MKEITELFEDVIAKRCEEILIENKERINLANSCGLIADELRRILNPDQFKLFLEYDSKSSLMHSEMEILVYKQGFKDKSCNLICNL